MADKVPLRVVNGVQIYVWHTGAFTAEIDGRWVTLKNLRDLEKKIAGAAHPVDAMIPSDRSWQVSTPERVNVTSVDTDGRCRYGAGKLTAVYGPHAYHFDAEAWDALCALAQEQRRIQDDYARIVSRLRRVTRADVHAAHAASTDAVQEGGETAQREGASDGRAEG